MDGDKWDRMITPIYIQDIKYSRDNTNVFNNKLNTAMDHVWDGFYTGQVRLSRWPTILETNREYNFEYTGTPPSKQRFRFLPNPDAGDRDWVTVQIRYPKGGAYSVKVGG